MANEKISAMTAASAMADADLVPGVQGGANVKFTGLQIKTFAGGGIPADPITFTGDPTGLSVLVQEIGRQIGGNFYSGLAATDNTTANSLDTLDYGPIQVFIPTGVAPAATSLTSWSMHNVTTILGTLNCTLASLTTLDISSVTTITGNFTPTLNVLTTLDLSSLTAISTTFNPTVPAVTTLDLSGLTNITVDCEPIFPAVTTLDLSALVHAGPRFLPTFASLLSFDLPACVDGAVFPTLPLATSVSLPVYADDLGAGIDITAAVLTTLAFPAIVNITGGIGMGSAGANIANFTLGSTLENVQNNVDLSGLALTQASVDGVLASLVTLDGTNGTTLFQNQTVDLSGGTSSAPSTAGLANAAVLTGRGCTVTTN